MIEVNFQIKKVKELKNFGKFIIEPLPQGYGYTLGNSLRRVMLASLPGWAITQVKISNVKHKFSYLNGMKEDVIEVLLNLKKVRIKAEDDKPIKLSLEKTGPSQVTAGDIEVPAGVEIVNKDLVIANLADKNSRLKMEMLAEKGYGYLSSEERKSEKLGVIILDAIFSPVLRVNYKVEQTRVGGQTDLDRLILEIDTDGTITPFQAIEEGARILISFFSQIVNPPKISENKKEIKKEDNSKIYELTLEEIEFPTRITNSLRKAGFETVADLAKADYETLKKIRNLGKKSLESIFDILNKKGIKLSWELK